MRLRTISAAAAGIVALVAAMPAMRAQTPAAVHSFTPGAGQSVGQDPEYFPANVLGLPDPTARRDVPSIDPRQIASLGIAGEIILRFDAPIIDGAGADFTVFENAFYYTIGPRERLYAEPAEVAVSRDGLTFVSYPFDTLTLAGCAGTAPTNGDRNPYDPAVSGGNAFDLSALDIDSVRYVRIRDVTAIVARDPAHPFWDPTLSGFDLDAVVAIPIDGRITSSSRDDASASSFARITPNPASDRVRIRHHGARSLRLIDVHGNVRREERLHTGARDVTVDVENLSVGTYVVELTDAEGSRSATLLRIAR